MQVLLHPSHILAAGQIAKHSFTIESDAFYVRANPAAAKMAAEANAAFIVRAVNAHNELIEAVEAALNMVDGDGMPPNWDWLRSVVSKAKGGQP